MSIEEERLQILKMVEAHQISAAEGAKLLAALERTDKGAESGPSRQPRWFRVRVTDLRTGKTKVHVNIPMGLVNVGLKMGARFAPNVEGLDTEQITRAIREGLQGKIIDVEDESDAERVEIFIE